MIFRYFQSLTWIVSKLVGQVFFNLEVRGVDNLKKLKKGGGVLFVANHQGSFDPFLIGAAIPRWYYHQIKCFRYQTYYKYIYFRLYGLLIYLSGAFPVFKKSGNIKKILNNTISILRDKQDVLMFPQARKCKYFYTKDARKGVGYLLRNIDVEVVPVFIKNTYKIKLRDVIFKTREVEVVFGEPFTKRDILLSGSDKEIAARVLERVGRVVKFPPREEERSYLNIKNREKYLETEEAQFFLNIVPENISSILKNCFVNNICDRNNEALDFFLKNSEMFKLINAFPGSAEAFEYLYLEKKPLNKIDEYFIKCQSGIQVHKRILSLDKNLPIWINKLYQGKPLLVDNIFSGPGRDMIRVVRDNPEIHNKIKVRNIDIDPRAIKIGKELIKQEELADVFSFECKSFEKAKPRQADLIILIGVLCPLKLHTSERMLRHLRRYVNKNGHIIYSTAQNALLEDDPFTDYLMRLTDWPMSYKSDEEAWDLAEESGWQALEQFFDEPRHHHCMTVAKIK